MAKNKQVCKVWERVEHMRRYCFRFLKENSGEEEED
jgi:hypothetical protein